MKPVDTSGGWGELPKDSDHSGGSTIVFAKATYLLSAPDQDGVLRPQNRGLCVPLQLAGFLAQAGRQTHLIGTVGEDHWGNALIQDMEDQKVSCEHLLKNPRLPTSLTLGATQPSSYPGAGDTLPKGQLPEQLLRNARHLHFDFSLFTEESSRAAAFQATQWMSEAATLSLAFPHALPRAWSRYDAQSWLRSFLPAKSLVAFPWPFPKGLFPDFWSAEALAEGAQDLGAESVFVQEKDGTVLLLEGAIRHRFTLPPGETFCFAQTLATLIQAQGQETSMAEVLPSQFKISR